MNFDIKELSQKIKDENFISEVSSKYFDFYDKNNNNYIDKKELMKIMADIARTFFGCEPEKVAMESQFQKIDKDRNNHIDRNEFRGFIKEYLKMLVDFKI